VFICGPCGASGKAWQLAAFIAGLDPDDKRSVSDWLRKHGLLNHTNRRISTPTKRDPVAIYEYRDASGNPVARKLRFEPGRDGRKKDFSWQHWENGSWIDGLGSVQPLLYRLPEIKDESIVVLVEGEKDAESGSQIGLPTTTSGSCNSWQSSHTEIFIRRRTLNSWCIVVDLIAPSCL
jgi:hypothetical protein